MSGSRFLEVNHRIEEERRMKYRGTASIELTSLCFQDSNESNGNCTQRSADGLKRMFQEEHGCRQEGARHHAIAVISQRHLDAALEAAGLPAARLLVDSLPYPELELPPNVQLDCLQGRDRILAADNVFEGTNKRWVVDLFLDDLSQELRTFLIEEYDYHKIPDDGEFFCKIREYQGVNGQANPYFEKLWLALLSALSKNRRERLDQLFRHSRYLAAFDALLDIRALFCGFRLTVIHQMISMKCDEQNLSYLEHIFKFWCREVCNGDVSAMQRIDIATIEAFQGTAPGAFSEDRESLGGQLRSGHLFVNFTEQQREEIWRRVCSASQHCVIPSLYTFFEDMKFLKNAADCIKRLMHLSPRDTVTNRLENMFTGVNQRPDQCIIQISGTAYGIVPGNAGNRLDLGCRQLWLATFREYLDVPPEPQKNKRLLAKPRKKVDETVLFDIASFASRLGFESEEIRRILRQSPDREVARGTLLTARKPDRFRYNNLERAIEQMVEIFDTALPVHAAREVGTAEIRECFGQPARCGIPHDLDHDRDKRSLFLPTLHGSLESDQTRITSLFVRRSVYFAFFGQRLAVDINQIRQESFGILEPVTDGHRQSDLDMETEHFNELAMQTRVALLATEEREKQENLEELTREIQEQGEKLSSLWAQLKECEGRLQKVVQDESVRRQEQVDEQVRLDHLIIEQRAKLDLLVAKEAEQLGQLGTLTISEQAQKHELGRLGDLLQERRTRCDQLAAEERERQATLDSFAETQKLERERCDQLAAEESERRIRCDQLAAEERERRTRCDQLAADERERQATLDSFAEMQKVVRERDDQFATKVRKQQAEVNPLTKKQKFGKKKHMRLREHKLATIASQEQPGDDSLLAKRRRPNGYECVDADMAIRADTVETETPQRQSAIQSSQDTVVPLGKTPSPSMIRIEFKTCKWTVSDILHVDPSDPSEVQRVAAKYLRKQEKFRLFDTKHNNLVPGTCFEQAVRSGTNTILVIPVSEVDTISKSWVEK